MIESLQFFHFLRPFWLLALPLVAWMWWLIRPRRAGRAALPEMIAPHLAAALQVGSDGRARILPIDGVALGLGLMVLAVAGPA